MLQKMKNNYTQLVGIPSGNNHINKKENKYQNRGNGK